MRDRGIGKLALLGAGSAAWAGLGLAAGVSLATWALWRRTISRAEVRGRTVLITGATRGLGLAMAREFVRLGANLVICARDPGELERARAELERMGASVLAVACDVSVADQVKSMVDLAVTRFGGIDFLINNAGIITVGPMEVQTVTDYQECLDVMFWGTVYPTLAVLPHMMQRRSGRIANITSIGGKVSVPHLLPYNCAKFAAVGFSEGLRAELAKDNIQVTTVVPGLMRTGSFLNAYFKGNHHAECGWFSIASSLPLLTMGARRAARSIVRAVRHGSAEIVLTPQARLLALFHGIVPGITADILGVVNRMLPAADGNRTERRTGRESESGVSRSFLTLPGRWAAEDLHESPAEVESEKADELPGSSPASIPA